MKHCLITTNLSVTPGSGQNVAKRGNQKYKIQIILLRITKIKSKLSLFYSKCLSHVGVAVKGVATISRRVRFI